MAPELLVIIQSHRQYIICTNHLPGFMYLPQVHKSNNKKKKIQLVDCLYLILNNQHLCKQPSFKTSIKYILMVPTLHIHFQEIIL